MKKNQLLKNKLLLTALFFFPLFCFAQVSQVWVNRQNGDANSPDRATAIAVDNNANVYITGRSFGSGTQEDFATVKYNSDGAQTWVKRYNGPGNSVDAAAAIAVAGGFVYVTGRSVGSGTGDDYVTIKYDENGSSKWVKRYNGPGNSIDGASSIAVDASGNVYVTGQSVGSGTDGDYATIKYNAAGVQQWVARYNGPGNSFDLARSIAVDASGNVYVTGSSVGTGTGNDYATIKYNAAGVRQWVARYNGPVNSRDEATALALDALGNVSVTGFITTILDEDGNSTDYATIRYSTSGVQRWVAIYNGNGIDRANAIAVDASGNVYVTGSSGRLTDEDPLNAYATVKYNTTGIQQWVAIYDSPDFWENPGATDLALDAAGNVYVTGGSRTGKVDYATIRYNTNGVQQWVATYDGPAGTFDAANAIVLDVNGNVYITGRSEISGNTDDYATIKYTANGAQKWLKRYNGPGDLNKGGPDFANDMALDPGGNVIITGSNTRNNTGLDYTTIKYDEDGDRKWKKIHEGNGPDIANALVVDANSNVYVTGQSYGIGTLGDYATIRYLEGGDKKWRQNYNGPGNGMDIATAIALDATGNVYVTGNSLGSGTGLDYATIKYSPSGVLLWVSRYNGPTNRADEAYSIAVDASGNVYVTGQSMGNGTDYDYATIKYNAAGVQQWVARYNGPFNYFDGATSLAIDASGNVYVTGSSYGAGAAGTDYTTIKYNAAGVQQWVSRYNGPGNSSDGATSLAIDASGNVHVTGSSGGDYATIKYNAAGTQQWVARYGPGNSATSLALDASGNVYVTGSSDVLGSSGQDYATIKYNATGIQQWVIRYNGPGNSSDRASSIAVAGDGTVYVTGGSTGDQTGFDYATIKYTQSSSPPVESPQYVELNNLVVVYKHTNGGDIPDDFISLLKPALEEASRFYWRNSHMGLNVKWTIYVIEENLVRVHENGYVFPSEVDADLRSRGFTDGSYDAVLAVVNGAGAYAWGANQILGRGGYFQVPWWEEHRLFSWFITHEFNHIVDNMFAYSGHPDYSHNHPGAARVLGEFVPHSGTDWDLNSEILRFWERPRWFDLRNNGNWGTIKSYIDNDLDIIPDNDENVPLDEARLGSSALKKDTDEDGLSDLQEAMAGIFTSANPLSADSDGDGIPDNTDAEPIYPLNTKVPARTNLTLAQDVTAWPLSGHYFFGKPDGASSSLHLGYSENNLYIGVKIPSSWYWFEVFIDANNDGLFYGKDNIKVVFVDNTISELSLYDAASVPPGDNRDFIISALPTTGFSGMLKTGSGWSSYQVIIPKLAQYGLNLAAGETVGIYINSNYGVLLEPNDYLTVTLGDGLNSITKLQANKATVSATEKNMLSEKLHAVAFPSPFTQFFTLKWNGSNQPVSIKITDAMGRLIEKRTNLAATGTTQAGHNFRSGVYYAEVVQGTEKVVVKLIKY